MRTRNDKQKVAIVTDSAVCLPSCLIQEYDIHIVPFQLIWDGNAYLDGEEMGPSEFSRRFGQDGKHPTTAQPLPQSFANVYERVTQEMTQRVWKRFRCEELYTVEFTPVRDPHTGPGIPGVASCLQEG